MQSHYPDLSISDLLRSNLKLATPPNIYFAVKKILEDPAKTLKDVAFVIEKDAALTAKLLKIVNSAYFGFPSQILSIETAITLIGARELENLILSTEVIERFANLPGLIFSMHDFWARNLRCALLTREFDSLLGKKYADSAFLCGLLHNIGQLLIYQQIPELAREVEFQLAAKTQATPLDEVLIQQQVIGFDHFQVGAELCRTWKLPNVFVETIRFHPYPDYVGTFADIAAMVRLANYFSTLDGPYDSLLITGINLNNEQIDSVLLKCNEMFEVIFKLFYPKQ